MFHSGEEEDDQGDQFEGLSGSSGRWDRSTVEDGKYTSYFDERSEGENKSKATMRKKWTNTFTISSLASASVNWNGTGFPNEL